MRSHMLFEATGLPARVGTGGTFEGFFASVCHQMLLQIPAGGGGVVTGVASIWLFTSVRRDVLLQSTRFTTRVRTSRTLVWLLPWRKGGAKKTCFQQVDNGHYMQLNTVATHLDKIT